MTKQAPAARRKNARNTERTEIRLLEPIFDAIRQRAGKRGPN